MTFLQAQPAESVGTDLDSLMLGILNQDARDRIKKPEISLVNTLSIFAQIAGLPIPPLPPGLLWLAMTAGGLVFGISKLIESSKQRSEEGHIERRTASSSRSSGYEAPSENIEAKLRKLASLKDQNLISEEEYQRKRQEIIARW
jgi:Short C-terminal domain